jgi:3-hydroxybutyryl-CoA dehydrogenase
VGTRGRIMIKKIGVVGAGQMGAGIAQVAAMNGFSVMLNDVSEAQLKGGIERIEKSLSSFLKKGRITEEEKEAAIVRIQSKLEIKAFETADFVVEAVIEDEALKVKVFKDLDETCKPGVILATNTSSISITRIAAATRRSSEVIGMHFMNPVPLMELVEIIRGLSTSDKTFETTRKLAVKLKKTPVAANDSPGFISNRILMPMINEAIFALYEGVGTAEAIDSVMKLGMNHPMGPLALADLIGLDTCLSILEVLHEGFGDPKYHPCPLLRKYVDAGYLGRKTGRGLYTY